MNNNPHIGGTFDEFLSEQGILEECEDTAIKQILADKISTFNDQEKMTKDNYFNYLSHFKSPKLNQHKT